MLRIEIKSRLNPEEAVKRAVKFFGPDGHGMTVEEKASCCVQFEGAGGGVLVTATPNGKGSSVEFESREWDFQVKEFVRQIK